jgi:hypothetical protein
MQQRGLIKKETTKRLICFGAFVLVLMGPPFSKVVALE